MNNKQTKSTDLTQNKIKLYFLPFAIQIEMLLVASLSFFFIALLFAQAFIHTYNGQVVINKALRYEGVFTEKEIEAEATLQRQ